MADLYNDYEISSDALVTKVTLPSKWRILLFSAIAIGLNFFIGFFLIADLADVNDPIDQASIGAIYAPGVFIAGLIGGIYWRRVGFRAARATYVPFVDAKEDQGWFSRLYVRFVEEGSEVYLEGASRDPRIKGPKSLVGIISRISLSQLGFFITALALLIRPFVSEIRSLYGPLEDYAEAIDIIIGLGIAVLLLGLYLPMSIILEDSNIRTFTPDSRFINVPGSTLRGTLDALVGISAISTGWGIFLEAQEGKFLFDAQNDFIQGVDYIFWLVFIMLLSWPLIYPAALYYFLRLESTINEFRAEAFSKGVPIGVSKIREPNPNEVSNIAAVHKVGSQVPKKSSDPEENSQNAS